MNKNSRIAILGYGIEGRAMTNYLIKHEFKDITICDRQENLELNPVLKNLSGPDYLQNLEQFDHIFRSPGISIMQAELIRVKDKLTSQIKYFIDQYPGFLIGITGTKGKGTTSTLISKILGAAEKIVFLGGNIGEPPINFLDNADQDSYCVLELSSFQLHDLQQSPPIAVILNTTSDHLDYHADLKEYLDAKSNICRHQHPQDFLVLNTDYPYAEKYQSISAAQTFFVSIKHPTEVGAYILNNKIFINRGGETEEFLMDTNEVGLIGSHNLENILPAITVARILGIELEKIHEIVAKFTGLPHRLELVGTHDEINYYNDSFSTTPETAMAAINSFPEGSVFILLGGSEKHSNFTPLGQTIVEKLAIPICYGETGPRIIESILATNPSYPIHNASTFEEAFNKASELATSGDNILLSPASASFDLFPNYKVRGETFRELVGKL